MERNILKEKSYQFALDAVLTCKEIFEHKKEFVLSKQLLRSATSVGANVEEAIGGHTEKDFLCKIAIAYKEARESNYWVRLLSDAGYLDAEKASKLEDLSMDLIRIMAQIQLIIKNKQAKYNKNIA